MDPILGMTPTGRRVAGPAADLVEVQSANGLKHTAIVLHDEFVEHPALIADMKEFGKFMENPGVTGIAPLKDYDHKEGYYLYATGQVWSVAEVVRIFADMGDTCGIRAGLELAYVAAQILQEAEEAGAKIELFNHGSLSPWNVMLRPDGQVAIVGYGFAQVEVLDFLEDESLIPKEDSFRYAPPERLEDEGEDLSSDLFALALIALELMTGRPVYDGLLNDIRQQATRAEGAYRLYKWRNRVPDLVREALGRALKYDVDARYPSATDFVYAVHDLIGSPDIEGPSLHEVMRKVRNASNDSPLQGGHTALLTKEEMKRLAAEFDDDDDDPKPLAPPKRPRNDASDEPEEEEEGQPAERWGKVQRPGRKTRQPRARGGQNASERRDRGGAASAGAASGKDALRDRLKSGRTSAAPAGREELKDALRGGRGASPARGRDSGRGDKESARASLKDSLQRGRSRGRDEPEEEAEAKVSLKDSLKQRLRESAGRRRPPPDDPPPEPEEEPEEAYEDEEPEEEPESEQEAAMAGKDDDDASSSGGAAALLARLRSSAGARSGGVAARLGATKKAEEVVEDDAPVAPPPPPPRVASTGNRSSATSSRDTSNDGREVFEIVVQGTGRKTKLRLGDTLAQVADRLGHALAALPTDLLGNITGWYRIQQDGKWFPGHETTDVLDPSKNVELAFVHQRIVPLVFEVEGIEPAARFQAPVSTVVPAKSLLTHLSGLLALPAGAWRLYVDGQKLEPLQILEDFEPQAGQVIKVKR